MKSIITVLLLTFSAIAQAETKAAMFNNSADYMAFIESHPAIRVIAVTTLKATTSPLAVQLIVTYEEPSQKNSWAP